MRVKKNKKKLSDLDNFLESLAVCGDFARAAGPAGVSNEQLDQWFNDSDASDIRCKIALARYKGQFRKNLRTPLMTQENFMKALRHCQLVETKTRKSDPRIISLLIKNPKIKDQDGARKLKISIAAYKMLKKRLLAALFKHLTIR